MRLSKTIQNVQATIHPAINRSKQNFSDTYSKLASMCKITKLFLLH